jgi:hypothetical protein
MVDEVAHGVKGRNEELLGEAVPGQGVWIPCPD